MKRQLTSETTAKRMLERAMHPEFKKTRTGELVAM